MAAPPRSTKAQGAMHETFETIIPGVSQLIAVSNASVQGSALGISTTVVRLFATNDCYIKLGANPTALADGTSMFVPGGIVDFIGVTPGDKIAVIRYASNGSLFVTEGL